MFYYRYTIQDGNWSDMLYESNERRCKDSLYEISDNLDFDIEYEIYESNLIDSGVIESYVPEEDDEDDIYDDEMLEYVLKNYADNKSIEEIKEEMRLTK